MNKKERVEASLAGQPFDRAPVSFWYHFGVQHEPGERIAEIELNFFNYFDLDYLKLMNDYYYPMPEGMQELKTREDLKTISHFNVHKSPWAEQLKAINIIASHLDGEAYFVDTIFEPWQCLIRNLVGEHLPVLVRDAPDAILEALEIITDNIVAYCKAAISAGAAGVFLSTFSSSAQMDKNHYMKFAYPFVKRIMEEIKDMGIMNTLHLHDYGIFTEEMVQLPAHIVSYEDTDSRNPSIAQMRAEWNGSIMAGMDKNLMTRVTPRKAIDNALTGLRNGGNTRFFLAPGCSFPTWLYPESGKLLVEAVQQSAN